MEEPQGPQALGTEACIPYWETGWELGFRAGNLRLLTRVSIGFPIPQFPGLLPVEMVLVPRGSRRLPSPHLQRDGHMCGVIDQYFASLRPRFP